MSAGHSEAAERDRGAWRSQLALPIVGITLMAVLLRLPSLLDAFWLDEIWSLELAEQAGSAARVFTALHHDNNHYLNTLYLLALGPEAAWPLFRLPALLAGAGVVYLAGRLGAREGRAEGVLAAFLLAVSYPFVLYSSEARGYGLVVLLSLAAYATLARHLEDRRFATAGAFAATASLGFLSHLTFLTVYAPLLAWSAFRIVTTRRGLRETVARLTACHLLPVATVAVLFFVDLRHLRAGGGPDLPLLRGWLDAYVYSLGAPRTGLLGLVVVVGGAAAVLLELEALRRRRADEWIFFLFVLAAPVGLLVATGTGYAPPRYFLASLPFALLLLARTLARGFRTAPAGRLAAGALLLTFGVGNGWRIGRFLAEGRGAYREAVEHMAGHTSAALIRVGSDHDFRNEKVLHYYARFLPAGKTLRYVTAGERPSAPPEWYLIHDLEDDFRPEVRIAIASGTGYALQAVFRKYGLSGWNWAVYRREERGMGRGPARGGRSESASYSPSPVGPAGVAVRSRARR
ncbi:MAG: hypothetical protein ACE5JR_01290 [Gemmatimonadota bacterium]